MLDFLKSLFGVKAKPVEAEPANITAPYKVPEPAATTPIPLVVEAIPVGTEASMAAPVKKSPKKQQFEKKPVAEKAPVKAKAPPKPRVPRKPVTK